MTHDRWCGATTTATMTVRITTLCVTKNQDTQHDGTRPNNKNRSLGLMTLVIITIIIMTLALQ